MRRRAKKDERKEAVKKPCRRFYEKTRQSIRRKQPRGQRRKKQGGEKGGSETNPDGRNTHEAKTRREGTKGAQTKNEAEEGGHEGTERRRKKRVTGREGAEPAPLHTQKKPPWEVSRNGPVRWGRRTGDPRKKGGELATGKKRSKGTLRTPSVKGEKELKLQDAPAAIKKHEKKKKSERQQGKKRGGKKQKKGGFKHRDKKQARRHWMSLRAAVSVWKEGNAKYRKEKKKVRGGRETGKTEGKNRGFSAIKDRRSMRNVGRGGAEKKNELKGRMDTKKGVGGRKREKSPLQPKRTGGLSIYVTSEA